MDEYCFFKEKYLVYSWKPCVKFNDIYWILWNDFEKNACYSKRGIVRDIMNGKLKLKLVIFIYLDQHCLRMLRLMCLLNFFQCVLNLQIILKSKRPR